MIRGGPGPGRPNSKLFPKDDFFIDLAAGICTCPAGPVTRHRVPMATHTDLTGRTYKQEGFRFDGAVCKACPLRTQCTSARAGVGSTVRLHTQEAPLQEARRLQDSLAYDEYRQLRVVAEHRLARLVQLGIRQARYFGRGRTKFQLYLAATVANLTLLADKSGLTGDPDPKFPPLLLSPMLAFNTSPICTATCGGSRSPLRWCGWPCCLYQNGVSV